MGQPDDHADLVAIARRHGFSEDRMADEMLKPVIAELLRVLPASAVMAAFERAAAVARAKVKATN